MARYQLILAYDGTDFWGFQRQKNRRTVQGEVETALRSLGWPGKTILAAGRTDTGVHASGQVIAFDLEWMHDLETLTRALNAKLPGDVAVKKASMAAADFHPRYDACWRTYHYHLYFQAERNPLRERYAWRVWPEPDLDLMEMAARQLPGAHDFAAFGAPPKKGGSTVREILQASWIPESQGARLEIKANAFLYHMVRRTAYLLTLIGERRVTMDEWLNGIQVQAAMTPGLAPAQGLVLTEVGYRNE